jgi:hypothetical protein
MNSVQNDGFSLEILVGGNPVEKVIYKDSNYYSMPQSTEYSVRLRNNHNVRADVKLWIGGHMTGIYRIEPAGMIVISNFSETGKRFVAWDDTRVTGPHKLSFYHPWGTLDNLVQVQFTPEKTPPIISAQGVMQPDWLLYRYECSMYTDGVTPYNVNNRRCNLTANDYAKLVDPHYYQGGPEQKKTKYEMKTPLTDINKADIREIIVRIIVDNDRARYRRNETVWNNNGNPNMVPPRLSLRYPSRPHTCNTDSPFRLSRKYYFDYY